MNYSFSRLYTHQKWNYAHNSENLKLMYQLQDSRLHKHNSIVFTHILNHIFAKPYGLASLTSHLFKLNWQNTSIMCQSIKEASGEFYCVVDMVLWPDQDRRWDADWFTCRSVSPHLYSYFYFFLAYEKLFMQSAQLNILLCYSKKIYICFFTFLHLYLHWFHHYIPRKTV